MKNKKMSTYMKIYLSVVSVFLLLLAVASIVLWTVLDSYESTRPKYVANKIFNKYFVTMDIGGLIEECNITLSEFESAEQINNGVKNLFNPQTFECFSVSSDENGNEKFAVASENKAVAYFTISPSGKKVSYGFRHCALSDVDLLVDTFGDVVVHIPQGYDFKLNGKTVGDSYITATDIKSASYDYMPKGVQGILYNEYTVNGLFFEPEITISDSKGNVSELLKDDSGTYVAQLPHDTELQNKHSSYLIEAASVYAQYLSSDASFSEIAKYLDSSAAIYKKVRSIDVQWMQNNHTGQYISDAKATEFCKYADDVFSCRITLKQTLTRPRYEDHIENIDIIFYVRYKSGKYLIYDIVTNG